MKLDGRKFNRNLRTELFQAVGFCLHPEDYPIVGVSSEKSLYDVSVEFNVDLSDEGIKYFGKPCAPRNLFPV